MFALQFISVRFFDEKQLVEFIIEKKSDDYDNTVYNPEKRQKPLEIYLRLVYINFRAPASRILYL